MQEDGAVSAVVLGGSNMSWPSTFDAMKLIEACQKGQQVACIMLQMLNVLLLLHNLPLMSSSVCMCTYKHIHEIFLHYDTNIGSIIPF